MAAVGPGGSHYENHKKPKLVWEDFKDRTEFKGVAYEQFRSSLWRYRKTVKEKAGWINWKSSAARQVLLQDLDWGGYLRDNDRTAEELWEHYRLLRQFADVPFTQFEWYLAKYREKSKKDDGRIDKELQALQHDRLIHPRQNVNRLGEPVFDMHVAKGLLQRDVEEKKHLDLTPSEFQATRREYGEFDEDKFKHRIYQEVHTQKYYHYRDLKRMHQRNGGKSSKSTKEKKEDEKEVVQFVDYLKQMKIARDKGIYPAEECFFLDE